MIAVCLKWVDRRPEINRLTGDVHTDPRTSGASDADLAALEWALRLGEAWGASVVALTAGPSEADSVLRDAVAAGAARAIRIPILLGAPSEQAAAALAGALAAPASPGGSDPLDVVVCGNWSLDRGTGAVPAFLAAHLGAAQALGLVTMSFDADAPGVIRAERRLDGGRRERLLVRTPAVLSVEGGSARLRRAPLDGVLRARTAAIEVASGPKALRAGGSSGHGRAPVRTSAFRPRAKELLPPPGDLGPRERILALTGALVDRVPPETVVLDPGAAADRLLAQLRAWGYGE